MKKIKVKTLYLIAIVVGGLIGLATKSTYALFTSSTEIDNPICMATNLTSEEEAVDTLDVIVISGEVKEIPITINNTSGNSLNYMVFYNPTSSDIEIGVNMKNADSSNSLGTININETKKVYVQIKNNSTSSITITIGVVSNNISSDMNVVPIGKEGESAISTGKNLAEYITNLYTNASKSTVTNNSITYNQATSVNLMNDRLGSSSTNIDGGNIRYYGASPNNYIYFNCDDYSNQTDTTCELWRIIGVFDGKVKIMRNEGIGKMAYDYDKNISSSSTTYDNIWGTSTLKTLLNTSYLNRTADVTYYSGYQGGTTTIVKTSTIGIKDTTRSMISTSTLYLRGWNSTSIYANQIYNYERTSGSVSGSSTTWSGKIALPYESDYGYAVDFNNCSATLGSYNNCKDDNWMVSVMSNQEVDYFGWLLTHSADTNGHSVCFVSKSGYVGYGGPSSMVYSDYVVIPTLYLDSNISVKEGNYGSSTNPFQIEIN